MPPREVRRTDAAAEITMTIVVDSVSYRFDLSNITAAMELELYQQSGGLRLTKVMEEITDGATGFHIAAMIFLARRSEGDDITFADVANHMGLASDIEVIIDEDEDEAAAVTRPEAIAAG